MRHDTQVRLIDGVHAMLARGDKGMAPEPRRLSVDRYIDPERFERERSELFAGLPLAVAHSSELRNPGDFKTVDVSGVPVLLTRDEGGALNALLNVCRHRGTQVVHRQSGCKRTRHTCPYHAWTYAASGELLRITDAEGFPGVDRADRGLVRLPTAERGGFVFVRPDRHGEPIPDDWLGSELDGDFASYDLADHVVYDPRTLREPVHWKLFFDLFLEAYHIRYAHKNSIYPLFFDNEGLYERFGDHQRNLFPKRSLAELEGSDRSGWDLRAHSNILYLLFPNIIMLVQPDHVSVLAVYPEAIDSTRVETYTLIPKAPTSDKARAYWDANNRILYGAVEEDVTLGRTIQQGLKSGANTSFMLGRFEHALGWFHDAVDSALAE